MLIHGLYTDISHCRPVEAFRKWIKGFSFDYFYLRRCISSISPQSNKSPFLSTFHRPVLRVYQATPQNAIDIFICFRLVVLSLSSLERFTRWKKVRSDYVSFRFKRDQALTRFVQRQSTHTGICIYQSINQLFLFLER